jgi:ketosteroid isomerase-like protein
MAQNDKAILLSMVQEMAASTSSAQTTKNWAEDALWFDIPPFASKGIKQAIQALDNLYSKLATCNITILYTEVNAGADMGVVSSVQKIEATFHNGMNKTMLIRATDCFKKTNGHWLLFHQHVSVPAGGEWDGTIKII